MEIASSLHQIEWGVARKAMPGQTVSGDLHLVLPHSRGVLLAVVDGCGHGPEAARAAELAVATLRQLPENTVLYHLNRCHVALAQSRGAVMTLADYNARDHSLTLCGVGNVEAMLFRTGAPAGAPAQESALLRGGVVGGQLPNPYASVIPVYAGDVLVIASDGLRLDFNSEVCFRNPPQRLADYLLKKHFKGNDDALALVVRFRDDDDA